MRKSFLTLVVGFSLMAVPSAMGVGQGDLHTSVRQACQVDLDQYCKDITPGEGREAACLKAHDDKISAGCKQEWQNDQKKWDEFMKNMDTACSEDIDKLCQGSTSLEDVLSCLTSHTAELTTPCKTFSESHPQVPT